MTLPDNLKKEKVLHFYKNIAHAMNRRKKLIEQAEKTLMEEDSKFNVKIALSFVKQAHSYDVFVFNEFDSLQNTILELINQLEEDENEIN